MDQEYQVWTKYGPSMDQLPRIPSMDQEEWTKLTFLEASLLKNFIWSIFEYLSQMSQRNYYR